MNTGNLELVLGGSFSAGETPVTTSERLIEGDGPEMVFEKTFDQERLDFSISKGVPYKPLSGRNDPFDLDYMRKSIGAWSALIHRTVITFGDACEHAIQLTYLWAEEDKELAAISQTKVETKREKMVAAKTNIYIEGTKEYEIEEARVAWREAVRVRNEKMVELNATVEAARARYRALRGA